MNSVNTNISKDQSLTEAIGTLFYWAPEQENSNTYTFKADLYSLGIIIFEMFYPLKSF